MLQKIRDRSYLRKEGFDTRFQGRKGVTIGTWFLERYSCLRKDLSIHRHAGKAWPPEHEVAAHIVSAAEGRERRMLVFSTLAPFYSVWDSSLWNGAAHS